MARELFLGPFRRRLPDGRVEFFGYDGEVEWRGYPRDGVVFPAGYEEAAEWWWKFAPLSVQVHAYLRYWRMSPAEAARATAVPLAAVSAVLALTRPPKPVAIDVTREPVSDARGAGVAARA